MKTKGQEKVDVDQLRIGMYVAELDRPWLDSPFLFQGFPIRNQDELEQLQASCNYVYIDIEKSVDWRPVGVQLPVGEKVRFSTRGVNSKPLRQRNQYRDKESFTNILPEAIMLHSAAKDRWKDCYTDRLRRMRSIDS